VEFEATLTLAEDLLYLMVSTENQRIRRQSGLGYRSLPQSETDWALNAGVLNGGVNAYPENNPEQDYPGFPETTYKAHLVWTPSDFRFSLSGVYSRAHWLNFEHTLKLPESMMVRLQTGYEWDRWSVSLAVDNLTDEEHFLGSDPLFASNTLVTKGQPRTFRLKLRHSF